MNDNERQTVPIADVVKILRSALDTDISAEKERILEYDNKTPAMVVSEAGSGKTFLLMLTCLTKILSGELNSGQILGITFSHDARADMQSKYRQLSGKLDDYIGIKGQGMPYFSTFHALFLRLLRQIRNVRVLPGYTSDYKLYIGLNNQIKVSRHTGKKLILRNIFQLRSQMIGRQISYDGLTLHDGSPITIDRLGKIISEKDLRCSSAAMQSYIPVVTYYQNYKHDHHYVDFNDMQVLLLKAMSDPAERKAVHQAMRAFKFCFIDEFQDISPLQWTLMGKILPNNVKQHLMVVGDDDQSIYAFRGSDPNIILNFARDVPDTKIMHLSMNYRTGGNILKATAPMIEDNDYRLPKKLQASAKGKGYVLVYDNGKVDSDRCMMHHLNEQIKDPKIDDGQIAILCRYNVDRMLAIDWLATNGYYVRTGHSQILQQNYVYRAILRLEEAFWYDHFGSFKQNAARIGFRTYRNHIKDVEKAHKHRFTKLSKYLTSALKFDSEYVDQISDQPHGDDVISDDHDVYDAFKRIHAKSKKSPGTKLFSEVESLVDDYFTFMTQHHFIGKDLFNVVKGRMKELLSDNDDIDGYFRSEKKKLLYLTRPDRNDRSPKVHIMSIHQSKGLQFQYVYLLNLTNKDVDKDMVKMDDIFDPSDTYYRYLERIIDMDDDQFNTKAIHYERYLSIAKECHEYIRVLSRSLKKLFDRGKRVDDTEWKQIQHQTSRKLADIQFNYRSHHEEDASYPIDTNDAIRYLSEVYAGQIDPAPHFVISLLAKGLLRDKDASPIERYVQDLADDSYREMMVVIRKVEEERRLLYVGMTRAEKAVYINYPAGNSSTASPLLFELEVPDDHIVHIGKDGKFHGRDAISKQTGLSNNVIHEILKNLTDSND